MQTSWRSRHRLHVLSGKWLEYRQIMCDIISVKAYLEDVTNSHMNIVHAAPYSKCSDPRLQQSLAHSFYAGRSEGSKLFPGQPKHSGYVYRESPDSADSNCMGIQRVYRRNDRKPAKEHDISMVLSLHLCWINGCQVPHLTGPLKKGLEFGRIAGKK